MECHCLLRSTTSLGPSKRSLNFQSSGRMFSPGFLTCESVRSKTSVFKWPFLSSKRDGKDESEPVLNRSIDWHDGGMLPDGQGFHTIPRKEYMFVKVNADAFFKGNPLPGIPQ